jgi:hypothetical protein
MVDVVEIAQGGVDFFEVSGKAHLLDHLAIVTEDLGAEAEKDEGDRDCVGIQAKAKSSLVVLLGSAILTCTECFRDGHGSTDGALTTGSEKCSSKSGLKKAAPHNAGERFKAIQ